MSWFGRALFLLSNVLKCRSSWDVNSCLANDDQPFVVQRVCLRLRFYHPDAWPFALCDLHDSHTGCSLQISTCILGTVPWHVLFIGNKDQVLCNKMIFNAQKSLVYVEGGTPSKTSSSSSNCGNVWLRTCTGLHALICLAKQTYLFYALCFPQNASNDHHCTNKLEM